MEPTTLINHIVKLCRANMTDVALDSIYEYVDNADMEDVDELIDKFCDDINRYTVDVLIGVLTATLPYKSWLLQREKLFIKTREYLDTLTKGLE